MLSIITDPGLIQINLKYDCKSLTVWLYCIIDTYDTNYYFEVNTTTLVSQYRVVPIILHSTSYNPGTGTHTFPVALQYILF